MPDSRPILLAGPTATGKSEIALLLAEQLDGEIISVDSMQVWRGLNIGTAKPSAADRRRVPHHLIDVVELSDTFDAARFVRLAREAVRDIQSRGRRPILSGGTGLYFKAYLEGLGDAPPADAALRAELERTPLPALLAELERGDRVTYEKIDRQNPRRVVRAVEVLRLSGKPFSAQRAEWRTPPSDLNPQPVIGFGLRRERGDLRARIDARVEAMFRRGLVEEVRELLQRGLAENQNAMQAIGYRQVVGHLRGERSPAGTVELTKIRTRQFAKRQMTWFRRQTPLNWVDWPRAESAETIAARIAGFF